MLGRIVEVADDQRHLRAHRGFMIVERNDGECVELGRVPIDDIQAVIANAHGLTYTNALLVALAERGAPFVLCGPNHHPVGVLISTDGNFEQARRIDAQLDAARPTRKRLWAAVVRAKLEQQAAALEAVGAPVAPLAALVTRVRSGDPDNLEAQGARRYWGLMFGDDFRRDRAAGGVNAMLNYGYTILRAATARAVIGAGLHPAIGLHHSNDNNAMRLVDDLMEPFRPMLDLKVWQLRTEGRTEVAPETKRELAGVLYEDMQSGTGVSPMTVCIQKLATSLAQIYTGERASLELPLPGLALTLAAPRQRPD